MTSLMLVPRSAPAQDAPKMPPGMTPEIMKMMMTPLKEHPAAMPAGTKSWFGCVPAMGYHFVSDKNKPFGPIYGYYKGKATFTEIMVAKPLFDKGMDWNEQLKPLPGHHIDHVDIWFEPQGHPGYPVPHYDIHAWYVPHAEHMFYCNPSGKKPAFV